MSLSDWEDNGAINNHGEVQKVIKFGGGKKMSVRCLSHLDIQAWRSGKGLELDQVMSEPCAQR